MSDLLPKAYAICAALVQKHDADRHVATLFAPVERRRHLQALQAFSLEIAGIRAAAKEPAPGEIRLQWWREVLDGTRAEEGAGHPVGLAIRDTIERCRLPLQPFQDLIDARSFDLYDDPPADWNALEGYCGETSSALVSLGSIILTGGRRRPMRTPRVMPASPMRSPGCCGPFRGMRAEVRCSCRSRC